MSKVKGGSETNLKEGVTFPSWLPFWQTHSRKVRNRNPRQQQFQLSRRAWPCLGNRRWRKHRNPMVGMQNYEDHHQAFYKYNRKPISSLLLPPRSTVWSLYWCMAAEISTGHYFTAQQHKGNLFTRPRNRWKMKLSWHAFSEMENGLWAGKWVIRKELLGTQEVELMWTFFFF